MSKNYEDLMAEIATEYEEIDEKRVEAGITQPHGENHCNFCGGPHKTELCWTLQVDKE